MFMYYTKDFNNDIRMLFNLIKEKPSVEKIHGKKMTLSVTVDILGQSDLGCIDNNFMPVFPMGMYFCHKRKT